MKLRKSVKLTVKANERGGGNDRERVEGKAGGRSAAKHKSTAGWGRQ